MISSELLAINAIFITGFYVGYKLKGGVLKIREHFIAKREISNNNNERKFYY